MVERLTGVRTRQLGLLAWCVALSLWLYGRSLNLPFFFDDLVHLPYVDEHSLIEMWQSADKLAYFRPLSFSIWKVMAWLLGGHSPLAQHALNLIVQALNGLLVGLLAGWLWARQDGSTHWPRAFLATTLYLMFPFSYQAVPWIGSLHHLLGVLLVLLSLACYWLARRRSQRLWLIPGLAFGLLAPFAHENGVLAVPLLVAMLITRPEAKRQAGRITRDVLLWLLPLLIWLPVWWLAPRGRVEGLALVNGEAILQNCVYFLQGLAYPLSWLGGRISRGLGFNDLGTAAVLSLVALGVAGLIQWRPRAGRRADRRAWLPWLWTAVAALPAVLFLRFDYVISGPRLLMLAAAGAAWLWADVFLQAARLLRPGDALLTSRGRWWVAGLALPLLLLLLQNNLFIDRRMDLHQVLGRVYKAAAEQTVLANEQDRAAVFVNFPTWLAPEESTFALGHEGVQFLPDYAPPASLVEANTGQPAVLALIRYDAIRSEVSYRAGIAGGGADWPELDTQGGMVFVASYRPEVIELIPVGRLAPEAPAVEPLARFGALEGAGQVDLLQATAVRTDEAIVVELVWAAEQAPADQVTLFVHLVNGEGQLLAQADGDPLGGSFPLSLWSSGQVVLERRVLPPAEEGRRVNVGLYDRASGERLPAVSSDGRPWPDQGVSIPIR